MLYILFWMLDCVSVIAYQCLSFQIYFLHLRYSVDGDTTIGEMGNIRKSMIDPFNDPNVFSREKKRGEEISSTTYNLGVLYNQRSFYGGKLGGWLWWLATPTDNKYEVGWVKFQVDLG